MQGVLGLIDLLLLVAWQAAELVQGGPGGLVILPSFTPLIVLVPIGLVVIYGYRDPRYRGIHAGTRVPLDSYLHPGIY